jgi:hypothetical protein
MSTRSLNCLKSHSQGAQSYLLPRNVYESNEQLERKIKEFKLPGSQSYRMTAADKKVSWTYLPSLSIQADLGSPIESLSELQGPLSMAVCGTFWNLAARTTVTRASQVCFYSLSFWGCRGVGCLVLVGLDCVSMGDDKHLSTHKHTHIPVFVWLLIDW